MRNNPPDIQTPRLDLIAATPQIIQCEKDGGIDLNSLLDAEITAEWPPEHWEPHVLDFLLEQMRTDPNSIGWARFVALREPKAGPGSASTTGLAVGHRTLIGTIGAVPPGSAMDHSSPTEIECGYGILPAYQRNGYATEALSAMLAWVETQTEVTAFVAQTFPYLQSSIRVLEKSRFAFAGPGFEEGTILYRRKVGG